MGHVPQVNKLANILRCRVSALPLTYLGLPLGAPFKNKAVWNVVVERTVSMMETTLSFQRRETHSD